jgi:hypothetical protein
MCWVGNVHALPIKSILSLGLMPQIKLRDNYYSYIIPSKRKHLFT